MIGVRRGSKREGWVEGLTTVIQIIAEKEVVTEVVREGMIETERETVGTATITTTVTIAVTVTGTGRDCSYPRALAGWQEWGPSPQLW